jgi:hypothetical protein
MDSRVMSWMICAAIAALLALFAYWSFASGPEATSGPIVVGTPAGDAPVAGNSGITQMLSRTVTTNDPKQCTIDMTHAFLEQRWGSSKGTLDRCRRSSTPQSDPMAHSITVQTVTVTGPSAAASFQAHGSYYDGSVFTVRLVHQSGRWKLDALTNVQVDRPGFDQHLKTTLGARGYLPAETTCAIAKFDQTVSDDDLSRKIVLADSSIGITEDAVSCLTRPTLLRELGQLFTATLSSEGFRGPVVKCVVDRMTHGVPIARLRHLLAEGERGAEGWGRLGYEAARQCVGGSDGSSPSTSAA